jgi:transposase
MVNSFYLVDMQAIKIHPLTKEAYEELDFLYRKTKKPRMRTRSQMILLSADQGMKAPEIAQVVRESERTVQRWLRRYQAEGIQGLYDAPRSGNPGKVTQQYEDQLIKNVRLRPRALNLEFSLWTLERLADYMAEQTGIRISCEAVRQHLKSNGIVLSRPQHTISSPDPDYVVKKRR